MRHRPHPASAGPDAASSHATSGTAAAAARAAAPGATKTPRPAGRRRRAHRAHWSAPCAPRRDSAPAELPLLPRPRHVPNARRPAPRAPRPVLGPGLSRSSRPAPAATGLRAQPDRMARRPPPHAPEPRSSPWPAETAPRRAPARPSPRVPSTPGHRKTVDSRRPQHGGVAGPSISPTGHPARETRGPRQRVERARVPAPAEPARPPAAPTSRRPTRHARRRGRAAPGARLSALPSADAGRRMAP
ncbi:hypothetical protein STANM309S_01059 [Streptomyces tanashiensis]